MANGIFGGGTGTKDNPYLVEDVADLRACTNFAYYKQVADIDLSEYDSGEGFTPVALGTTASGATFSYDGNGFKITNLYQNRPHTHEVGLFRIRPLRSAINITINFNFENVNILNANITGMSAGVLVSGTSYSYTSYNSGCYNIINISNCFINGRITSILKGDVSSQYYNTGVVGTIDLTPVASSYSTGTHCLKMSNTVAVLDIVIQISDSPSKTYSFGLLGIKNSPQSHTTMYQRITNSCVHADIQVIKDDDTAILNIYGVVAENIGNDMNNVYVNLALNNVGDKEGVNLFYFTPNSGYTSNMIANHERGKVKGIELDNIRYLTSEQMKDLTYYKNLGWTIYE